jgi:hypothetical protein
VDESCIIDKMSRHSGYLLMGHNLMNKRIQQGIRLGVYGLVVMCTACGQGGPPPSAQEQPISHVPSKQQGENDTNAQLESKTLSQQVSEAIGDLASREGVAANAITVKQARSVHWGSSALGCPQVGMNYTQAIVPGIQLLLQVKDTVYRYHGGTGSQLSICSDDRAEEPVYGPGTDFM